jgi:hypothetical protein
VDKLRPELVLTEGSKRACTKMGIFFPNCQNRVCFTHFMIDAYEERTVGVYDIPGTFLHAKQTDLTYIKMAGEAVNFIVEISPSTYKDYVTTEKGKEVLYLVLKKTLYGCVKLALLFWEDLSGKLIKRGYDLNPCDRCVANKIVDNL